MTDPPHRILVVDDNPATRYSTSRVLRSAGFVVSEATNGQEAIRAVARDVDLVVLDVNLPDMDGFQVCREIRADRRIARIPVVHLSATFVNDIHKVEGLEAGADGYLTHPIEPPVLIATVRAFLRARRAHEEMRESEARFRAVFEDALNGMALIDPEMIFLDVNTSFAKALGDPEQVIGKHMSAFCPAGYEPVLREMSQVLLEKGAWHSVLPVLNAQGRQLDLDWQISVHSLPALRLAITTDVSGRKEIEAERERLLAGERAARADAERANRLKDDFLASLSHELRTPLNSIVGWSAVLRQLLKDATPEIRKGLEAIDRNARVQAQLISDLLDVSRITAGKLVMEREWLDPEMGVRTAIETIGPTIEAKSIQLDLEIVRPLSPLFWDPARFQQLVWNLIDNAVKFSKPGGRVTVSLSQDDSQLSLSVRDSGEGISAEFLPHVFDRFRQQETGTKRWHGGLGLGLAIVKQIVQSHGAAIRADSSGEGQGTTFTVSVPLAVEHDPRTDPALRRDGDGTLRDARVLVVEDDLDARELLLRVFQDAKANVLAVESVHAALGALRDFAPQLVVSDIGMPLQDGYDLVRRMRETGCADIPVIALTAFARPEDRERALAAGFREHLVKPLNASLLIQIARELLIPAETGRGQGAEFRPLEP